MERKMGLEGLYGNVVWMDLIQLIIDLYKEDKSKSNIPKIKKQEVLISREGKAEIENFDSNSKEIINHLLKTPQPKNKSSLMKLRILYFETKNGYPILETKILYESMNLLEPLTLIR